jgi:hypothetical protein
LGARAQTAIGWRIQAAHLAVRYFPTRFAAWTACRRRLSRYQVLNENELKQTRKSDTVFVFGSGYSLHDLTPEEWRAIEEHDTVGFNWFVHQRFVRCDYQLIREITNKDLDERVWRADLDRYFDLLKSNPKFSRTVLLIQTGFRAMNGNRAIGLGLAPSDRPVFLWRSHSRDAPTTSLSDGLSHGRGTLADSVNFAYVMGWKTIVLVGVDLYDRRYFWLGANQPRPEDPEIDRPHRTTLGGVVESLGRWRELFERSGVRLFVYNPKSLLATVLPIWSRAV